VHWRALKLRLEWLFVALRFLLLPLHRLQISPFTLNSIRHLWFDTGASKLHRCVFGSKLLPLLLITFFLLNQKARLQFSLHVAKPADANTAPQTTVQRQCTYNWRLENRASIINVIVNLTLPHCLAFLAIHILQANGYSCDSSSYFFLINSSLQLILSLLSEPSSSYKSNLPPSFFSLLSQ
jgi:hypothetical protein